MEDEDYEAWVKEARDNPLLPQPSGTDFHDTPEEEEEEVSYDITKGEDRTRWLQDNSEVIANALNYYAGPTGIPERLGAAGRALEFTDAGDYTAAAEASRNLWENPSIGNAAEYAAAGTALALPFYSQRMGEGFADLVEEGVRSYDPNTVRMFPGEGALRSTSVLDDPQSKKAQELLAQGVDDDTIWEETGRFFNPDTGQWHREIDPSDLDFSSRFTPGDPKKSLEQMVEEVEEAISKGELDETDDIAFDLKELFNTEEFARDYPNINQTQIVIDQDLSGYAAEFFGKENVIAISPDLLNNPENFLDVVSHELQHLIQAHDGTIGGAAQSYFLDNDPQVREILERAIAAEDEALKNVDDDDFIDYLASGEREILPEGTLDKSDRLYREANNLAYKKYVSNAGEIQARASAMRRQLTPEERRTISPLTTIRMAMQDMFTGFAGVDKDLDSFMPTAQMSQPTEFNEGGLVFSKSKLEDYKRVERGEMNEEEFKARHGTTTKQYEDDFLNTFDIDIVGFSPEDIYAEGRVHMRGLVKKGYNQGGMVRDNIEVDPVSGNPVPSGSEPTEVRDDVNAKLSEGEFVIPANVVQYYGVKYFDSLIRKAEEKLEEIPSGEPLPEEETAFNEGGMVGVNPDTVDPNNLPGVAPTEYKTYYGPNGEVLEILFIDGVPTQTIPEGYTLNKDPREQTATRRREKDRNYRNPDRFLSRDSMPEEYNPVAELDYDNTDSVLSWARERVERPENNAPGLLGRLMPGGLIGMAREATGLAQVNAAARVARQRGNEDLANRLSGMVNESDSAVTRLFPRTWYDGDRIAERAMSSSSSSNSNERNYVGVGDRLADRTISSLNTGLSNLAHSGIGQRQGDSNPPRPQARPTSSTGPAGGPVPQDDDDDEYTRSIT